MSIIDTGLPDGTEDFVGIKARELENLRNILLNKFYRSDYQLVFPSLIEFLELYLKNPIPIPNINKIKKAYR